MRFGLRFQILISLIVLMVISVVLVSFGILRLTERHVERQAEDTAVRIARIAATTMAMALDRSAPLDEGYNAENLRRLCALFSQQFSATRMAVVTLSEAGDLVVAAAYPPSFNESANDIEFLVTRASGEPLVRVTTTAGNVREVDAFVPIESEPGDVVAVLRFEFPLGDVQRVMAWSQQRLVVYVVLAALLIMMTGYFLLTRLIVRPLVAISLATDQVAEGNLEVDVAVRTQNEIGNLGRNFAHMLGRLREGRDALEQRVSDLAESSAALERAQGHLVHSEKMAILGVLAAGIAHEVGNPLAAVIGLIALLEDRDGLDEEDVDDLLARVDRELARIHTIIADLLDYARVSEARSVALDVREPLRAAVGLCAHHPRARDLQISFDEETGPGVVFADHNRLVQVLLNLLLNAADATGGAGLVRVDWRPAVEQGVEGVVIRVQDDGPGIEQSLISNIFDPFVTTKGPGKGTGLGLAISQRIIEQVQGKLSVESSRPGATVFAVWLPGPSPSAQV